MTAVFAEQIARGVVNEAQFIVIDHPEGVARFWTGVGVKEYGGNSYYGVGQIGAVTQVRHTADIEIVEVRMAVSGVDQSLLDGLDDSVKARLATVYDVLFDEHGRVAEIEQVFQVELDYQVFKVGADGKCVIDLVGHGGLFWLRKRSSAKWSPEEARSQFDGETGFDQVHQQEDLQDQWRSA